jgi:serine/threonine-protein kinase
VWKHADKVGKPIPLPLICRIIIDACAGLDYAHKKLDQTGRALNIVHRDISPQNILVSFEGGVKVVDFGIAKAADQATVTKSGVLKGKYSYMSPEQAAGQPIDCRSDIFALGVVLYELLTGTRLFKRATDIQTLNAVTECKIAPPSQINDRVPQDLDEIVMKALTKDRSQRFMEAKQLGAALEGWLLSNQLSGSTAALSEFMHTIYADRLKSEAEEGRLLVETADGSRNEELLPDKATPQPRQTKSMRATSSQAKPNRELEETTAERPASKSQSNSKKSLDRALAAADAAAQRPVPEKRSEPITHTEASMPTQNASSRKGPVLALVAIVVLALAAFGLWTISGTPQISKLTIDSEPAGAWVKRNDTRLCETPCTRELDPGAVTLVIEKPGFVAVTRSVTLKAGVDETLPKIVLEVEKKGPEVVEVKPPPENTEPQPPPSAMVKIETDPSGATLTINGEPMGVTPFARSIPVNTELEVKLELAGYVAQADRFTVNGGAQPHSYTLKALPKSNVKPPIVKNNPPPEVKPVAGGKGTVRFVVKPWAEVECPGIGIKDTTPFEDKVVAVGSYTCKFTNPDLNASQTKLVKVEANQTTKVQVTFTQ